MAKKLHALTLILFVTPFLLYAQDDESALRIKHIPGMRFDSNISEQPRYEKNNYENNNRDKKDLPVLKENPTEVLQRFANIYQMHLLSIEAQINNDAVMAESYITDALMAIQNAMNDYPEVQESRKFKELYRTVMTEYQEFYGIDEPVVDIHGEIFEVHQEMFMAENDWFDGDNIVLPENLTVKKTDVSLIRNRQVNNHIAYLTVRRPEIMENWLKRSVKYFPMMIEIFEDEGVPNELVHLAMVESGLVPVARSHARATGMWQFMRGTGAVYGLEVNWWIDERRDPEKATRAAAQHLRDLKEYWDGNWHMALANYNVSGRRMNSSVRRAGGKKNYWEIYPFLPRETRGYVPGFIAATLIAMNPGEFGFEDEYENEPYEYETVQITGSIDLSLLAECAGITTQELQEYNPELLRWATPPGGNVYHLKIPVETKKKFLANFEEIPDDKKHNNIVIHSVKRGETLGLIANRYGTTVRNMYQANDNLSSTIHPGQDLVIPVPEGSSVAIRSNRPSHAQTARTSTTLSPSTSSSNQPANTAAVSYTIKSGDTVGHIAHWFETRAMQVRSWNNISNSIRPGQRLIIYVPSGKKDYFENMDGMTMQEKQTLRNQGGSSNQNVALNDSGQYVVIRNDNLHDLAIKMNTSVQELMRLNGLSSSSIYVGQTLTVPN
ncbi:MAG: LysM peptidoglycan-binding domain-containing protein [Balneolales bacterium]